jgi:hypothetical protein
MVNAPGRKAKMSISSASPFPGYESARVGLQSREKWQGGKKRKKRSGANN